eukprot:scaffold8172_cov592-Prasinococcus_capsulatus_cf.AAC.1
MPPLERTAVAWATKRMTWAECWHVSAALAVNLTSPVWIARETARDQSAAHSAGMNFSASPLICYDALAQPLGASNSRSEEVTKERHSQCSLATTGDVADRD